MIFACLALLALPVRADCSYYAHDFQGNTTASGTVFEMNKISTAHRTLPFGTSVLFFNPNTLHFLVARVTDRGPFVAGREFDLSLSAFTALEPDTTVGIIHCIALVVHPERILWKCGRKTV